MFHALAMFHMSANVPCFVGCSTHRRVFHGDAPSRGQHRPGDFIDRNSPNNPSLSSNRGPNPSSPSSPRDLSSPSSLSNPNSLSNPSAPSNRNNPSNPGNRSNLSRCNNPGSPSNRSDYSSEASSFIPSSIRDLSRNEKLSLIVLRWLPSG